MLQTRSVRMSAWAVPGIPEIVSGDDLVDVIAAALIADTDDVNSGGLEDGDILTVTSKIVSKAEGRHVLATDREQAITDETVRLVASREHPNGVTRIVENRLGLVMAAAGVDSSNTPDGIVLLLPLDPDASGRPLAVSVTAVADELAAATDLVKGKAGGLPVAVVRGLPQHVTELDSPGARSLVRSGADDMFRLGTKEAWLAGFDEAHDETELNED